MKIKEYTIDNDLYFINAENGKDSYKIWIDNSVGRIVKISLYENEKIILTREYGDFLSAGEVYFPRMIKMVRPLEKQAISVYYTNLSFNEKIDRKNFIIDISDNAEQMLLLQ